MTEVMLRADDFKNSTLEWAGKIDVEPKEIHLRQMTKRAQRAHKGLTMDSKLHIMGYLYFGHGNRGSLVFYGKHVILSPFPKKKLENLTY